MKENTRKETENLKRKSVHIKVKMNWTKEGLKKEKEIKIEKTRESLMTKSKKM